MLPVKIEGIVNNPALYANNILTAVLQGLLGSDFVIDSFGAIVSLPGAEVQNLHTDSPPLFDEWPILTTLLPAYAITVAIPLVDITPENGPTVVSDASHKLLPKEPPYPNSEIVLCCKKGSILMWDYRTLHRGTSNDTNSVRPMLYLTYSRPWWQDHVNLNKESSRVRIDKETFHAIPEIHKPRFGPYINARWPI